MASLGLKAGAGLTGQHALRESERQAAGERIADFLVRHGYAIVAPGIDADVPLVAAEAGPCRLLAVAAAPQGWHRDLVHRLAAPGDRVFFVVAGAIHPDQPVWRTRARHYWHRLRQYAGLEVTEPPVLGVVASAGCDPARTPWQDFGS